MTRISLYPQATTMTRRRFRETLSSVWRLFSCSLITSKTCCSIATCWYVYLKQGSCNFPTKSQECNKHLNSFNGHLCISTICSDLRCHWQCETVITSKGCKLHSTRCIHSYFTSFRRSRSTHHHTRFYQSSLVILSSCLLPLRRWCVDLG